MTSTVIFLAVLAAMVIGSLSRPNDDDNNVEDQPNDIKNEEGNISRFNKNKKYNNFAINLKQNLDNELKTLKDNIQSNVLDNYENENDGNNGQINDDKVPNKRTGFINSFNNNEINSLVKDHKNQLNRILRNHPTLLNDPNNGYGNSQGNNYIGHKKHQNRGINTPITRPKNCYSKRGCPSNRRPREPNPSRNAEKIKKNNSERETNIYKNNFNRWINNHNQHHNNNNNTYINNNNKGRGHGNNGNDYNIETPEINNQKNPRKCPNGSKNCLRKLNPRNNKIPNQKTHLNLNRKINRPNNKIRNHSKLNGANTNNNRLEGNNNYSENNINGNKKNRQPFNNGKPIFYNNLDMGKFDNAYDVDKILDKTDLTSTDFDSDSKSSSNWNGPRTRKRQVNDEVREEEVDN